MLRRELGRVGTSPTEPFLVLGFAEGPRLVLAPLLLLLVSLFLSLALFMARSLGGVIGGFGGWLRLGGVDDVPDRVSN